jgi:uncharacterized protein YqeY
MKKKIINSTETFLPELMSEFEIEDKIKMLIVTYNFCNLKDIGKIMGQFNKDYGSKVDNKVVSQIMKNIIK